MTTQIVVTLSYDGCGLELSSDTIYSIGNQNVDATYTTSTGDCDTITVKLNDLVPPIEVCDGDSIAVTVESSSGCTCTKVSTVCETDPAPLFLTSKPGPDGKLRLTVVKSERLKKIKAAKEIKRKLTARRAAERLAAKRIDKQTNTDDRQKEN